MVLSRGRRQYGILLPSMPALPGLQDASDAIQAAHVDSHLISVTHPAAARQMQRVAVQLRGALQQIAAAAAAAEFQGA